jgi:acetyl esterase/lipase
MLRWLGLVIGIATLWVAVWIYLPAPTYFLLNFSVGGPEISAWLILASIAGLALTVADARTSIVARTGLGASAITLVLSLGVWVRVPSTVRRAEAAMRGMSMVPTVALRARPIVFLDLFRYIPLASVKTTRDIVFASPGGVPLHIDVYQPTRSGRFPVLVQVYGGAWQRGVPSDKSGFANWLASSGYVVIAIDYRHAPAWRWPAQIDDVNEALTWVGAHAHEYDGDTSRVVLMGRSAGAHLATMAGWFTSPIHIRGVVSYYGPVDLTEAFKNPPSPDPLRIRSVEEALLGGTLDQMPDRYADASTITHVRAGTTPLPPTLLIYGGRDHIVEPKYGALLVNALRARGTSVAYLEIPWADHAFDEVFNGPSSQLALYHTERFLAKVTQ